MKDPLITHQKYLEAKKLTPALSIPEACAIVGISRGRFHAWNRRYEEHGAAAASMVGKIGRPKKQVESEAAAAKQENRRRSYLPGLSKAIKELVRLTAEFPQGLITEAEPWLRKEFKALTDEARQAIIKALSQEQQA